MLHRNSQKRIYFDEAIYFITIVTQDRTPFFKQDLFCELFIKDLRFCKQLKGFDLYVFVILFNHIHLLIKPGKKYNISQILHNLKRMSSLHINEVIKTCEGEDIYPRLRTRTDNKKPHADIYPRLHKRGVKPLADIYPRFQWQKSFFDHYIRNDNDFDYHLEYIWSNPEKHRVIKNFEDYRYPSYNNYEDLIDDFN